MRRFNRYAAYAHYSTVAIRCVPNLVKVALSKLMRKANEAGSAVLPALIFVACFAMLANQVILISRSSVQSANAGLAQGRLAAAADSGLSLAVYNLLSEDPVSRWYIDGQRRVVTLNNISITIDIEDERGKVPLNKINRQQVQALFEQSGAPLADVNGLVEAFLGMRYSGRVNGKGGLSEAHVQQGLLPASGFITVLELADLPGMTPEVYHTLLPSITVSTGDEPFDPQMATPLALQVMGRNNILTPHAIELQRERMGERAAFTVAPELNALGRPILIHVTAQDGRGAVRAENYIVELTARPDRPLIMRSKYEDYNY